MNLTQQNAKAAMLTWPITQQGKLIAQHFAKGHTQPAVAERVRRNTLAVWVLHEFLGTLGITTDLSKSDSWNPAMQLMEDVADLVLPGVGRLECRPLSADSCTVPLEVRSERIGYVAVELDEVVGEAALLGFMKQMPMTQPRLRRTQLQTMDDFPDYVHQISQELLLTEQTSSQLTQLGRWLEGHFENGWRSAEDLLAQYSWTPAFRQARQLTSLQAPIPVKRAKQLDLNLRLGTEQVVLVLEVEQENAVVVNIRARLYPLGGGLYLPENLIVTVLDEADVACLKAQARTTDNYLQLYFRGHPGEPFAIRVSLGEAQVVEQFII